MNKEVRKKEKRLNMRFRVFTALIILIVFLVLFSIWFFFFEYARPCQDSECFVESMKNCERVSWIKEDSQASWRYIILGSDTRDSCKVEVELVRMKEGTIDAERLQGEKMICKVIKGDTQFPEKDISRCSGKLKEELQDIIIQRLHNYILQNLGDIKGEFGGF
jgi:hypothetical protein